MTATHKLLFRIRALIVVFMTLLLLSGITAFPIQTELNFLLAHSNLVPDFMHPWLLSVGEAVNTTAVNYPYLMYGCDWLAFAHIVIALFFVGVYRDPVRNAWVLRTGLIACAGVFVLAFSAAGVRSIPLFWTLIDCSFGLFGAVPLLIALRWIARLEKLQQQEYTNTHHSL